MNKHTPNEEWLLYLSEPGAPAGATHQGSSAPRPATLATPHADPTAGRRYFRCDRLCATLSRAHCQANRAKVSYRDSFLLPEGPPPNVQPWQCSSCGLALQMDRGLVPFFTAEEVAAGKAMAGSVSGSNVPPTNAGETREARKAYCNREVTGASLQDAH